MREIFIFSGTSEGRELAEWLAGKQILTTVSVATEYGRAVMEENPLITLKEGRMDRQRMEEELTSGRYFCVVDATHPFAVEVTELVKEVCEKNGLPYLRLSRETGETAPNEAASFKTVRFPDAESAAEYLAEQSGNILLTTGSRELAVFTGKIKDRDRIYARVLPARESLRLCEENGIRGEHILAMQGPFSVEMNLAMLHQVRADFLVTKESGTRGGFAEKLEAAGKCGVMTVILENPEKEKQYSEIEIRKELERLLREQEEQEKAAPEGKKPENAGEKGKRRHITLAGVGMGTPETMTFACHEALSSCEIIFASKRLAQRLAVYGKPVEPFYQKEKVWRYLTAHPAYRNAVVAFSGDTGFYSGAAEYLEEPPDSPEEGKITGNRGKDWEVELICGISTVSYFASRLGKSWQDMKLCSSHGRDCDIAEEVRKNRKCLFLMGKVRQLKEAGEKLWARYGEELRVSYGYCLSSPEEEIRSGFANILTEIPKEKEGLYVLYTERPLSEKTVITPGLADEAFLRDKVPMTKEEVREIILCKLRLTGGAVVYDIGAGTGSVSVECARLCEEGMVYAIERKPEAVALIKKNREKFGLERIAVQEGSAPEALESLPEPSHVVIGGNGGRMKEILRAVKKKARQDIRVVISAVTLETLSETLEALKEFSLEEPDIVQVSVSRAHPLGKYHLMQALNPVMVISFDMKRREERIEKAD